MKYFLTYALLAFVAGCGRRSDEAYLARHNHPAKSPSGKYLLRIQSGDDGRARFQTLEIEDTRSRQIFQDPERFYTRHTTFFLWDDSDRVWVYSGDIGTFFWTPLTNNLWIKQAYRESNVSAPPFLKRKRPEFFDR